MQLHDDYHAVFTTEPGKRVLADLQAQYHDRETYVVGGTNPVDLAFFEGQRSVVLAILSLVAHAERSEQPLIEDYDV
jgi:hypothetical protein